MFFNKIKLRAERDKAFERGVKHGIQTSIDYLRDRQKYNCKMLSNNEKDMVMEFLEKHNLEFGYDVNSNGFYVCKRTT